MTIGQTFFATYLATLLLLIAFCGSLNAQSIPLSPEGQALQVEMTGYVSQFMKESELTYDKVQYAVVVQPELELRDYALVYHWLIPAKGPATSILALFTFNEPRMLGLTTTHRRSIAAHEVGHVTPTCETIQRPNVTDLSDFHASIAQLNFAILNESCADIMAATLTTPETVLATLKHLKAVFAPNNYVLDRRIAVMERIIQEGDLIYE